MARKFPGSVYMEKEGYLVPHLDSDVNCATKPTANKSLGLNLGISHTGMLIKSRPQPLSMINLEIRGFNTLLRRLPIRNLTRYMLISRYAVGDVLRSRLSLR